MCSCTQEGKGERKAQCRRTMDEASRLQSALMGSKGPRREQGAFFKAEGFILQVFGVPSCAQEGHSPSSQRSAFKGRLGSLG